MAFIKFTVNTCSIAVLLLGIQHMGAQTGALDLSFNTVGFTTFDYSNTALPVFTPAGSPRLPCAPLDKLCLPGLTTRQPAIFAIGQFGTREELAGLAVQADGKILLAVNSFSGNSASQILLHRLKPDGAPDPTFNNTGSKALNTLYDFVTSLAVQPDGKILIGGMRGYTGPFTSKSDVLLIRLNANGSYDNSFGTGGVVLTDILANADVATDLVVQPDGKIAVATTAQTTNFGQAAGLARYLPNVMPDTGFGAGGLVRSSLGHPYNLARNIAYQPIAPDAGKIICSGIVASRGRTGAYNLDFAVARYNPGPLAVGVEPTAGKPEFSIQPNPATDFTEIIFPAALIPDAMFTLYDIRGRALRSGRCNDRLRLDVRDLPAGVYSIQIRQANMTYAGKIVKQ